MATPSAGFSPHRLRRDDVLRIVGDVEDVTVSALLATGADHLELEQALMWINGDGDYLGKLGRPLSGRIAKAYDILLSDPAFEPDLDR